MATLEGAKGWMMDARMEETFKAAMEARARAVRATAEVNRAVARANEAEAHARRAQHLAEQTQADIRAMQKRWVKEWS